MKILWITVCLLIAECCVAQRVDVSGNWELDKSSTDFHGLPEWVLPIFIRAIQEQDVINIEKNFPDDQGKDKWSKVRLQFDGKSYDSSFDGIISISSMKWMENDKSFIVTVHMTKDGRPYFDVLETWSLDNGGKKLIIKRLVEDWGNNRKVSYETTGFYKSS